MNRLDSYFKSYNKIDEKALYNIFSIEARKLLNHRRIDIVVKYYYIKSRENNENLDFAKELYEKHIEAFSDGVFKEHGNPEKNSIEEYIRIFDELIDSFKKVGFDEKLSVIPIGENNEILDGSHRVACALYFNEKVEVIKFPELSVDYGFSFFKRRLLDETYLDFIAKEYIKIKKDIYVLMAWPKIGKDRNIKYIDRKLMENDFNIVYKKKFKLNKKVLEDLIFNIYREEHWLGFNLERFKAVSYKTQLCYEEKGYLMVYILEDLELKELIKIKEDLRDYFQVNKSSVHTADSYEESMEILNFLLDKDYENLLHQNFIDRKDIDHTFSKYLHRRLRYLYRKVINKIKSIIGKPV